MIYLLIDFVVNTYFHLPSFLVLLNLKSKDYFDLSVCLLFLYVVFDLYVALLFIGLYILYNKQLKSFNQFFKDVACLILFLIFTNTFYKAHNFSLYLLYNIPFYFAWYIFRKKSINLSRMIKYGYKRRNTCKNEGFESS